MEKLSSFFKKFGIWILLMGVLTLFLSAGYLGSGVGIAVFVLAVLISLADPAVLLAKDGKNLDRGYLYAWGLVLLAVIFFFVRNSLDVPLDKVKTGGDPFITRLRYLLLVLFVLSIFAGIVWRLTLSLGYSSRESITTSLNQQRSLNLNRTLLSIFAVVPLLVLVNYLTIVRNPVWDLSPGYYSFGPEARTIIKSIDQEVQAFVFLPVQQAVRNREKGFTKPELLRIAEDVRNMVEQMPVINSNIKMQFKNADLQTDRLAGFKNIRNGTILFRVPKVNVTGVDDKPYVERRVYVYTERDMDKLEHGIIQALIQVSAPKKTIYFTAANGERYSTRTDKQFGGVKTFLDQLRFYNFTTKVLDHNKNWPGPIPDDADAVVVLGPKVAFDKVARQALKDYLGRDGRIMVAIDPGGREQFDWLLENNRGTSNYKFDNTYMSLQKNFPGLVVTDGIAKHRLTDNISTSGNKFMVMPRPGRFELLKAKIPPKGKKPSADKTPSGPLSGLKSTVILNSGYRTILDKNRNGVKDKNETSGRYHLGVAYEQKKGPAGKKSTKKKTPPKSPAAGKKDGKTDGKPGDKNADKKNDKQPVNKPAKREREDGPKIVFYSGVDWLSDQAMRYRVLRREHRNVELAVDSVLWLTENPLAAAIQPKKRKSRSIRVTDDLKLRNMVLGIILFPVLIGLTTGLGVFFYRRKRKFIGE